MLRFLGTGNAIIHMQCLAPTNDQICRIYTKKNINITHL